MERQHWFHCTSDYHGQVFLAKRIPPKHRSDNEPLTPRLCVAPSVAECFSAVLFREGKPVYCYRTESPRRAVAPRNVWDDAVTRERWLIPPVTMVLDRVISADDAERAQYLVREYHWSTKKGSSLKTRVAQLSIASDLLGGKIERNRAKRCCRIVGIQDAELFLMQKIFRE